MASFGHVRDLKPKELSIDIENNFTETYVTLSAKEEVVKKLQEAARSCSVVYLASDNDREGESIAWHVKSILPGKVKCKRIVFNEITQQAIGESIKNPRDIDMALVEAQQTRRIIDRIMGFKLSPLLWKQFKMGNGLMSLSAGRVQSATLKLLVDREKMIQEHESKPYWSSKADFVYTQNNKFDEAKLYYATKVQSSNNVIDADNGEKEDTGMVKFDSLVDSKKYLKGLKNDWKIIKSRISNHRENPPPPFITSTLQQDAYNKIGLDVKSTMRVAQDLYEEGLITYMRTDSTNLSDDVRIQIEGYVIGTYGKDLYESREFNKRKIKNAQEAHEAIRPTKVAITPDAGVVKKLGGRHAQLYDLIWKRAIASQMKAAHYLELVAHIVDKSFQTAKLPYVYVGKVKKLKFPGYKVVYGAKAEDSDSIVKLHEAIEKQDNGGGKNAVDCTSLAIKNTWTSAPSRYNESGIIKLLEDNGIGRPSTYASILSKLYEKQYVIKQNTQGKTMKCTDLKWEPKTKVVSTDTRDCAINAENNRLVPSDVGLQINDFLENYFHDLIDSNFTAQMEDALDLIATKEMSRDAVLGNFWSKLEPRLEKNMKLIASNKEKTQLETKKNTFMVDVKEYNVRIGKYGPLIEEVSIKGASKSDKRFIGLRQFLTITKKSYMDVTQSEVEFFVHLPMTLHGYQLHYGRYGFYLTKDGLTVSIFPNWIKKNLGGPSHVDITKLAELTKEDIQKLVDAKEIYQNKQKETGTKPKTPRTPRKPKTPKASTAATTVKRTRTKKEAA